MVDDRYRFRLGDFECIAILDNTFVSNAQMIFPNVPPEELNPILEKLDTDPESIPSTFICLAVNTGTDWVLLDTGVGDLMENSKLRRILQEEDIQPQHIIITHAHGDHFGGLIAGDGGLNFPNAQVYMCRDEWAVVTSDDYLEANPGRAEGIKKHLVPAEGQIERVECGGEVLPGFRMIPLPGHSPHHVGIEIESEGEKLLFASDTAIHPLHIEHVDWQCGFDADHAMARASREKFVQMTAESGCLVLAFHFDFPGLGYVIRVGEDWKWKPLNS